MTEEASITREIERLRPQAGDLVVLTLPRGTDPDAIMSSQKILAHVLAKVGHENLQVIAIAEPAHLTLLTGEPSVVGAVERAIDAFLRKNKPLLEELAAKAIARLAEVPVCTCPESAEKLTESLEALETLAGSREGTEAE